jgi:transcriptional regulator GlxA family with amidase domain
MVVVARVRPTADAIIPLWASQRVFQNADFVEADRTLHRAGAARESVERQKQGSIINGQKPLWSYGSICRIFVIPPLQILCMVFAMAPLRVGFLGYERANALDLVGPAEAFASAFRDNGKGKLARCYEVSIIGLTRKSFTTESGILFQPTATIETAPKLDTLIIPGGCGLRLPEVNRKVAKWIVERASETRRIASVCTGIYGLAATGLLDGRRTTTHWRFATDVAKRFPNLKMEPNALFVKDGLFYTSAGVTAGIDLALALIEQDAGRALAMNVARILVVYLKRAGGQSQYSALLAAQAESDSESFSELERWIVEHLKSDLSVDALANRVHMSPRNFARVYAAKRGRTPAKTVEAIRVDAARRRLEETDDRIEAIAEGCGFSSEEQMRCAFLRILRIPPRLSKALFLGHHARMNIGRDIG